MSVQNAESFYVSPFLLTLFVEDWFKIPSVDKAALLLAAARCMLLCRPQVLCFLLYPGPCLVPSCITEEGGIGLKASKRKATQNYMWTYISAHWQ